MYIASSTTSTVVPVSSVRDRAGKRVRSKPVDGRTHAAKRWRTLHAHYIALAGQRHDQLCRALASLIVERERIDLALARGEPADPLHLVRVSGEIRRIMTRLGLDEEPAYDGTANAIRAL